MLFAREVSETGLMGFIVVDMSTSLWLILPDRRLKASQSRSLGLAKKIPRPCRLGRSPFDLRTEAMRNMLATQSVSEDRKQTLELGDEQSLLVRRAFSYDPSAAKWLKMDRLDFLSTIDLRVAFFLPATDTQ